MNNDSSILTQHNIGQISGYGQRLRQMDTQHRQGVGHTWLYQYMVQLAGQTDSAGTIGRSIWLHVIYHSHDRRCVTCIIL